MDTPKKDNRVVFLTGFGYDPEQNGTMYCPMSLILFEHFSNERVNYNYLLATTNQSDPTIFVERPETGNISTKMLARTYGDDIGRSLKLTENEMVDLMNSYHKAEEKVWYGSDIVSDSSGNIKEKNY
jgi:hypothetical protein